MFHEPSPLETGVLPPRVHVRPTRGVHLRRGDVVSLRTGQRYLILHIEAESGTVWMTGIWQRLDANAAPLPDWKRRERFCIGFIQWVSIEVQA